MQMRAILRPYVVHDPKFLGQWLNARPNRTPENLKLIVHSPSDDLPPATSDRGALLILPKRLVAFLWATGDTHAMVRKQLIGYNADGSLFVRSRTFPPLWLSSTQLRIDRM